ncbi:universal stress protein [Nocardioides sambongensis]|uniref:universal stress protein n=1 Tax=Nocardioides sambongensis TaxID=2589074 RepID=UPI001126372F|nr:universal stress protein [Nocardioides sambongensis]
MELVTKVDEVPHGAVVVGTDGSPHAEEAVRWAAAEAARQRRPLVLVHSTPAPEVDWLRAWGLSPTDQEKRFADVVAANGAELVTRTADEIVADDTVQVLGLVTAVDPRVTLLDLSEHAALVVVGSRGRGPVRRLLLGSTGVALVRHAHCPLVVLRPRTQEPDGRGVVIGVTAGPAVPAALRFGFAQADARGVGVTVVHAVPQHGMATGATYVELPPTPEQLEEHRRMVAEITSGLRESHPDVAVTTEVVGGHPEQVLHTHGKGADLLVVGAHDHHPGAFAITTSVVEHAQGPVAVVPPAG